MQPVGEFAVLARLGELGLVLLLAALRTLCAFLRTLCAHILRFAFLLAYSRTRPLKRLCRIVKPTMTPPAFTGRALIAARHRCLDESDVSGLVPLLGQVL